MVIADHHDVGVLLISNFTPPDKIDLSLRFFLNKKTIPFGMVSNFK
jgi:hypothetical protein